MIRLHDDGQWIIGVSGVIRVQGIKMLKHYIIHLYWLTSITTVDQLYLKKTKE